MNKQLISFVIPCYGSEKTIEFVCNEIREVISQKEEYDYEIIAVNDCSPDNVWSVLNELAGKDRKIKCIGLAKNMNRPGAVMAGLNNVNGEYVVVMDDDGQCPMDRFWDLLAPLYDGFDVSMADYPSRKQSAFKDFGTWVNKKMTEFVLDRPKDLQFTNFMVMRRYIVDEIIKYRNPYPYMTGLILRTTRRITCVPMEERERYSGNSGFSFKKLLGLWLNGLTAFSIKPLRLASFIGLLTAAIGFIYGIYVVIAKLSNPDISAGYSSIMAVLLFTGGMIMVLLGLIGEYVGRIYISINDSPQYVIRDLINFDEEDNGKENQR